jgi:dihydroorotase (multifunctional complex type)
VNVDIRIHGGTVHLPWGESEVDVLIDGERIGGFVAPETQLEAKETIEAKGLHVLPGLVDLHAHSRTPGLTHKEDFRTLSHAAAVGGITTIVDMPNVEPPTDSVQLFEQKREIAARDCIVDWGHFVSGSQPDRVRSLATAGVTGFKIFMVGGGYPHDDRIAVSSNAQLFRAMRSIAPTGLPCLVHPFDQALFDMFTQEALAAGRPPNHVTRADIYAGIDIIWRSAVTTLLEFQEETDVRLHLLHTHASGSLQRIRDAKARGVHVTAAIDPKYFHLTQDDLERLGPRAYSGAAVTSDPERLALIWRCLKDGTIDTIDSDHGPHTLEEVEVARLNAWKAQLGSPQYDDLLSLMLTDVNAGLIDLSSIVRLMCENPARLIGRYPQKGAVAVGSDADLVLIDLKASRIARDEAVISKVHWTPYAGRTMVGLPVTTIRRGEVIARNRTITAPAGSGRYLEGRALTWGDPAPGRFGGLALQPRLDFGSQQPQR